MTYTSNGMLATLKDAENNLTTYEYDGFDRLAKTRFPVTTQGANQSSTTDYEQMGYDAASNVTSFRNRAGQTIAFGYDNLDRQTSKDLPGSEPDVTYAYDLLGRLISAQQTGNSLSFTYDALGRNLTQVGPQGTVTSEWDVAGRRTKLTYPGTGLYVNYDHLVTGEVTKIRENGATSGVGVLATYAYDDLGRRTSITRGNGTVTSYTFDPVSRLASLTQNLSGTANDLTIAMGGYNPASQITSQTRSNDLYAWTGHGSGSTAYVPNGLNQLTSIGGSATAHDAKGNVTGDPTTGKTYGYSSENLLTSASGGVALTYDPQMRLYQVVGGTTIRFAYDGLAMIAEYNGTNALQRRFVHGPGVDEPIVQYEGTGTTDRRFLHADERGSIIASSNSSGAMLAINAYDEYGKPGASNTGRFQYTGQMWIGEVGAYYYKARFYSPSFGGRFLQTDRIGYADGMNLYAYVGNDPITRTDPSGLEGDLLGETIWSEALHEYAPPNVLGERGGFAPIFGRMAGGRLEAAAYESFQAQLAWAQSALARMSRETGVSQACLLSPACTDFMLASAAGRHVDILPLSATSGSSGSAGLLPTGNFDGQYVGDRRVIWKYRDHAAERVLIYLNKRHVEERIISNLYRQHADLVPPGTILRGYFHDDSFYWQYRAMVLPNTDISVGTVHPTNIRWPF